MPTPTAAERLHAQQQKNRKAAGLPDPSEYKKKLDAMKSEEVEQLDEISSQLKASYVAGAKKQIKQSMPFTKKSDEYRDIAKNFIAKRQKGIAKASKVEEQLEKKGRFVSGPVKQPFKSNTILTSVKEGFKMGRGNVHQYDRNPAPKDGSELENVPFHAKTEKQKKLQSALNDLGKKMKETHPKLKEDTDEDNQIVITKKGTNIKKKIAAAVYNVFKHHGFRKEDADPCWKGYKMVGMKNKNGRQVPNCVPGEGVPSMKKEDAGNPTEGEMKGKQQGVSRKAQIVMNAAGKGKKSDNPDKFQKDPELSSEIHKT